MRTLETPGYHWKWGLKHPIQAVKIAYKFSRLEGYPIWQLPYTIWSLTR